MSQPIDAIYENGVLKPLQPLNLPEHAQVKVTVQTAAEENEYQAQLDDLKQTLTIAEEQSTRGQTGTFDAEKTKQRLRDRLAQQESSTRTGINE